MQQNQGQQGQNQMNGQGNQFDEQNVLQLALDESKYMTGAINAYILEATDEQLRRDYMTVMGDIYSQQKQIFDLMEQKGFYQLPDATPQAINQAKNKFSQQ